jgi:dTDP-6-deoxy-L-talose 4-dehydrogenase (NAD+)
LSGQADEAIGWSLDDGASFPRRMGSMDLLMHFAWSDLHDYDDESHLATWLPLHFRFLSAAMLCGVPAVFVAGTCLEYGLAEGQLAEDSEVRPTLAYAIAKDQLRRQLEEVANRCGTRLIWGRIFYVYGEDQRETSLYPSVLKAIKSGQETFELTSGHLLRDYIAVDDLAADITSLCACAGAAGTFNLCSGQPIAIKQLVEGWIAQREASLRVISGFRPCRPHESLSFWGDRRKLDSVIGSHA